MFGPPLTQHFTTKPLLAVPELFLVASTASAKITQLLTVLTALETCWDMGTAVTAHLGNRTCRMRSAGC